MLLWGPIWPNTVGPVSWQPGLEWQIFKTICQTWPCDACAKSCKKKNWFGQRGGVNRFKGWCRSGAKFGQRELGQFMDNQDLHHRKSKCIMSAMAMWCHVPSLVRNKFCLAKGEGLIGSRFGAVLGPSLAKHSWASFWTTNTWITKIHLALYQPWPCDACAKSCKKKISFGYMGVVKWFKWKLLLWGPVWPNPFGQFLHNQDLDHKNSSCIMSNLAMWCHVPSLVRNKFGLAKWEGLTGSNKSWRRSYIRVGLHYLFIWLAKSAKQGTIGKVLTSTIQ